jgi:hypothetical protein
METPASLKCHQIVTTTHAKRAKTEQIQKIETAAILRLAKGFSWILYEIANRRFYFSSRSVSPLTSHAVFPGFKKSPPKILEISEEDRVAGSAHHTLRKAPFRTAPDKPKSFLGL